MYDTRYLHHWFDNELESQAFFKSMRDVVNDNGKMTLSDLKHICKKDGEIAPEDRCYIWTPELMELITAKALESSRPRGKVIVVLPKPVLDTLADMSTSKKTRTEQVEKALSEDTFGWEYRKIRALEEIAVTLAMMYDKM